MARGRIKDPQPPSGTTMTQEDDKGKMTVGTLYVDEQDGQHLDPPKVVIYLNNHGKKLKEKYEVVFDLKDLGSDLELAYNVEIINKKG